MGKVYGYARVSTAKQKLQRQIDNIKSFDNSAILYTEKYTGTKIDGREELNKLLNKVAPGDTIIFDSVSRMSRNAEDGIKLYFALYDKGINLVFLKERYIDTDTYRQSTVDKIELQGTDEDEIFKGLNNYFRKLAIRQIRIAFDQAEKEVTDLRQRVKEGIARSDNFTLKDNNKHTWGCKDGTKLTTKKSLEMKERMLRHLVCFGGTDTDIQFMNDNKIARNTFYKYKRELLNQ